MDDTCKNCGRPIEFDGEMWRHVRSGLEACSPFKFNVWAEPNN